MANHHCLVICVYLDACVVCIIGIIEEKSFLVVVENAFCGLSLWKEGLEGV